MEENKSREVSYEYAKQQLETPQYIKDKRKSEIKNIASISSPNTKGGFYSRFNIIATNLFDKESFKGVLADNGETLIVKEVNHKLDLLILEVENSISPVTTYFKIGTNLKFIK